MTDELIGAQLGQYHLTELVRRGGMATVYKAHQSSLDRYVAVHAYGAGGGRLRIEATFDGDRLVVVVADDGTWRPPLDGEGRGLHIIEQMSDTLEVDTDDYGTTVRFTRLLALVDGAGGASIANDGAGGASIANDGAGGASNANDGASAGDEGRVRENR